MNTYTKDLWNATLYDGSHHFVSAYGHDVIELLQPKQGEKIIDIGCGTGDLTNALHEQQVEVIGVDYSAAMIEQAKKKYPHVTFAVMNAEQLAYTEQFDAAFSNAALHWMKNPQAVLQSISRSLVTGGRFIAELGGAGNIQAITQALIEQMHIAGIPYKEEQFPWYFPTIGEYSTQLEAAGFQVGFMAHFSRPTKLAGEDGMVQWLDMFSQTLLSEVDSPTRAHIIQQTSAQLKPVLFRDGDWYADYKRLRLMAIKR